MFENSKFTMPVNFNVWKVKIHNACKLQCLKSQNSQCLQTVKFEKSKFTMPVNFNVWKVKIHNACKL